MAKTYIPLTPLTNAIEKRGGLPECFEQVLETEEGVNYQTWRYAYPQDAMTVKRFALRIKRAEQRGGKIDLYEADDICIKALGVHPVAVYGEEWFEFAEGVDNTVTEDEETEALAA